MSAVMHVQAPYPVFPIQVVATQPNTSIQASSDLPDDIEDKIARAEGVLTKLLREKYSCVVSFSAGKDSSAMLNLLLSAAAKMAALGQALPPIVVLHADTMIEMPAQHEYARSEMDNIRAFARKHNLPVTVEVSYPNLNDQWMVRVIGGRALPSFPTGNADCSIDMKIRPMSKLRKKVIKRLQLENPDLREPCVLIGTRYEESAKRSQNMILRGESDTEIRRGKDGNGKASHLFLSPLAYWTVDDVWTYLAMARGGAITSYSDFEDTFRIYADSMGVSCVIVAEDMQKSMKKSKGCGARTGCSLCTVVGKEDKSMVNLLATDSRYDYMRGLNNLRNFVSNTRWDMNRRSWVGRTIRDGYVRIAPDAYSPDMMEELLRYALTIDAVEVLAARAADLSKPRFQLVDMEALFAIDAMWSLQAFHRPFHALKIMRDIENGARYPVPEVPVYERPKELAARHLWVGKDWEDGEKWAYTGLRSAIHELASMDGGGCMGTKELADGRSVLDMNTGEMLSFNMEAAWFVLDELDELIIKHHDNPKSSPTQAYFYYSSLGMMTIKSGMEGEVDQILRRSNFKVRAGLAGQQDPKAVWSRAITAAEAGIAAAPKATRGRGAAGSLSTAHESLLVDQELDGSLAVAT